MLGINEYLIVLCEGILCNFKQNIILQTELFLWNIKQSIITIKDLGEFFSMHEFPIDHNWLSK